MGFLTDIGNFLAGPFASGGENASKREVRRLHNLRIANTNKRNLLRSQIDELITPTSLNSTLTGDNPLRATISSRTKKELLGGLNNADLLNDNPFASILGDIETIKSGTGKKFKSRLATEQLFNLLQDQPGSRQTKNISNLRGSIFNTGNSAASSSGIGVLK